MADALIFPPEYVSALRRLAPADKLAIAASMYREARALKAAGLRAQHPDWSCAQVERAVRSIFLHGNIRP